MSTLYVELLGSPKFSVDSHEVSFARRRSKALVIYIICTERRVTREELADLFWPDHLSSRAMGSLRTVLSDVRFQLQEDFLHSEGNALSVNAEQIHCDLIRFRAILRNNPTVTDMKEAADLWKGGFLKGFYLDSSSNFYDWQLQEEQNVFSDYKRLLRTLYEKEIEIGDLTSALSHARTYVSLDSFDEEGHRAVMYLYALRGERKLALEQFEISRRIMEEEFQSPVEDETFALVQRIKSGEIRKNLTALTQVSTIPRLAILPFQQIHIEDSEMLLFVNMAMEALEDFFAVIPHLRIISRTSTMTYRDSGKRLSIIAAELQADFIIEGFCRAEENSLLMEGRLIQAKTDEVLIVKNIAVSSLEAHPVDAAKAIGEAFTNHLGLAAARENEKVLTLSSKLKLQAKHLLRIDEDETCLKAVELYREVVHIDPDDAEAWAGIGAALLSYSDKGICFPNRVDEIAEIKHVALQALALDAEEPTALTILGNIAIFEDWDFKKAEEHYRRALQLRPNNTRALRDYAELCIMTGRHQEAQKLSELLHALDPLNHHNFKIRFWLHLVLREFDKVQEIVRQQFLLYPASPLDQILQAHIQLIQGETDAAIICLNEIQKQDNLPLSWEYTRLVGIGYAYAVRGQVSEALAVIDLLKMQKSGFFHPYIPITQIYIGLKDFDAALNWIHTAVDAHDPGLFFLAVNPLFAPLNTDPRLEMILRNTHIIAVKDLL